MKNVKLVKIIHTFAIKELVSFVNRVNYPLFSQIKTSIFEMNLFLLKHKETTLIKCLIL